MSKKWMGRLNMSLQKRSVTQHWITLPTTYIIYILLRCLLGDAELLFNGCGDVGESFLVEVGEVC